MQAPETLRLPERLAAHIPVCTGPDGSGELPGWSWTGAAVFVEYARVSPSVRLARWLDGSGLRCVVAMSRTDVGAWSIHLWCPRAGHVIEHGGSSRDRTVAAALDKAEAAGATTEGEQHDA